MPSSYFYLIFLHVIGASVWVGGHLVLAFTYLPEALKSRSVVELQKFETKFEKIGIPALVVQIITGLMLALRINPDWGQWFDFDGPVRGIGIKLILLLSTALLAVDARLRIIPKLKPENLGSLAWHIVPVTIIGVLFTFVGVFFKIGGI
jgi:putative copper export protein